MFAGLTIPHFDVILSLVGGSTVAATNFIFPPLYYLMLARQTSPEQAHGEPPLVDAQEQENEAPNINDPEVEAKSNWLEIEIPSYVKVLCCEIILIGVVGGISSTFFAIKSLVTGDSGFTVPCYVDISVGNP